MVVPSDPRRLPERDDGLPGDDGRAWRFIALMAVAGVGIGLVVTLVTAALGRLDIGYAVGLPLAVGGFAGSIATWRRRYRAEELVNVALADLPFERRNAVRREVFRPAATAPLDLSGEERRCAVYVARASVGSLSWALVGSLGVFVGLAGVQAMLGFEPGDAAAWFRAGFLVLIVVAVVVIAPLQIRRIRRARAYALREDHVLDAPAPGPAP